MALRSLRLPVTLIVMAVLSLAVMMLARQTGLARLDAALADRLTLTRHAVTTQIGRYVYLPSVVARDARVLAALEGDDVGPANAYLREIRELSGADEVFLLNPAGVTLAASNHAEPGSFVGQDYSFRPYFVQAMAAGEGRYYAVGVTTGIPGYFLAARIGPEGAPLGVAVAKVDLSDLARTWAEADPDIALADALGVVFLSGHPDWMYRPLAPLPPEAQAQILAERRYPGQDIAAAHPLRAELERDLRLAQTVIQPDGWQIVAGQPVAPVIASARLWGALAGLSGLFLSALGFSLWQRRQLIRVRIGQAAELERRVAERTEALAAEIEERRRAQEELRRTHDSLVHAAKLAVLGRMSSTIVHEVSQPLSALDTTLAAAELHLGAGNGAKAGKSVTAARGLVARMQTMVRDLRRFGARPPSDPPGPVDMAQVLAASAEVLAPRLKALGQSLALAVPAGLPPVRGHASRLEQVATNLMLNAAEAAAGAGTRDPIAVALAVQGGALRLTIADRGPGIDPDMVDRIQEPFFTTRITGEGLGLGLSITRGILDQSGGSLAFHPRDGGGTVTEVILPQHEPAREAAE